MSKQKKKVQKESQPTQPSEEQQQQQPYLSQPYDTTFKDWISQQPQEIVPQLLPGFTYEGTLTVEIIKPVMRVDTVFLVRSPEEGDCIAHFECETGYDPDLPFRLPVYNTVLHYDYHLPVITTVVYPFRTKMVETPIQISYGKRHIITLDVAKLALWEEDAQHYVNNHIVCMYPYLPTMKHSTPELLKQAMDELAELFRDNQPVLTQNFVWMQLLLERSDILPLPEKVRVKEQFTMYDPLWENHPKVKQIRAESEARGKAEGEAEGEARGKVEGRAEGETLASQRMFVNIVKARFPALGQLAQQEAARISNPDALDLLAQKVVTAPDENVARWLLTPPAA